jgi:hypothetical protein
VRRLRLALSVVLVLLVAVGVTLLVWSLVSQRGILGDLRDAALFDLDDAAEFVEQYGQERRRPGERLYLWGCVLAEGDTYRCRVRFDSGRRLRFYIAPVGFRDFRVVKVLDSN